MVATPASEPLAKASRALPAYFGGKRRLVPIIFALINERLPRTEWPGCTFLDPFSGGGATALAAKAHGFRVVAADSAERAAVVARALVANCSGSLKEDDVLDLFRARGGPIPRVAARYARASSTTTRPASWTSPWLVPGYGRSHCAVCFSC